MRYFKYNKKIYRLDEDGKYWVYDDLYIDRITGSNYIRQQRVKNKYWRSCMLFEITQLQHHLKRKRACEKTEAEAFVEII